jgi:hypothetical protein
VLDRRLASLDSTHDALGHDLKELDVSRREGSILYAPDVQDADHSLAGEQRDAEHRADALLPQDRVCDRRGIDAVKDDGLTVSGDPPREPGA